MTLEEKDRQNLIGYRLQQAKETMDDVQLLINNKRFRSAVNRIYYGMFYALMALGSANRFETSKHAQLIGWFNRNFIYEGKIDARFGRIINKAFNRRTKGDYDTFVEFEEEIVIEMYAEMNDFIDEIESYIRKN